MYGVLGSVCALSSSLFTRGFVNEGIVEPVSVSDVINFRLELVIIPRCFCSEVVVRAACTLTTTSMLSAVGCVGVDAQSLLVSSTRFEHCFLGSVWVFVWCFWLCSYPVVCHV